MFETLNLRKVDNLLSLMQAFRTDQRPDKVDLGVGVYKNDAGDVPVMRAVKEAEQRLVADEESKNYVGIAGDAGFRELIPGLLLGADHALIGESRIASIQTPGGTGALKVACDMLQAITPGKTLWVSTPTWANHIPIATDAGLTVAQYPYFRGETRGLEFDAMMEHLRANAQSGDALMLHACCHNPTGVDLSSEQWKAVTDFVLDRGLLPVVDCAYQGLADGMDADVAGLRHMAARVPEMLIASSNSKNFAIYRERTGALSLVAKSKIELAATFAAAETVIRSNYSMPPSHGARVVSTVLQDSALRKIWEAELTDMRDRITSMRSGLRSRLQALDVEADTSFLTDQRGMFTYTGFTPDDVHWLREMRGIYMAGDGRINIAGLGSANIDAVAEALAARLA
ncbi:aminotransferase class I/II-fold pyridoxal phosphate-dependent enzyme [Epibacterium sp. SM1969]|uniref:Aminotransferase class I/II-fold pyridoxal phosphate-dependent enzyme n=1 Tax=Tritonibacter aquimaris TaxID=2663379 RepID=A0A844B0X6_9RHOB|nr:amino acid aminotransferase [Tritonibacter aquimaris]MQY43962.1 aminotransferase class I/II-fold pyridoxal phosphate-dependent enzyme [Tritonibacter aquimaris]